MWQIISLCLTPARCTRTIAKVLSMCICTLCAVGAVICSRRNFIQLRWVAPLIGPIMEGNSQPVAGSTPDRPESSGLGDISLKCAALEGNDPLPEQWKRYTKPASFILEKSLSYLRLHLAC